MWRQRANSINLKSMSIIQASPAGKVSALLFDFGGTLAFLDFETLATEFSRPDRKLDALKLEHAEYAGRAALDHHLMSEKSRDTNVAYEDFFRAWMEAAGIPEHEFADISARFRAMHAEACMWRIVRDGTHDALERLKSAGFKLGIVSNADGRVAGDAKRLGLAPSAPYRLENSILPSVSVGTPLQVAGRYLQVRTVSRTWRSPASPALSRMSGLCTRPSVPMMKLTLTFLPWADGVKSGSGVVRASGGRTSSQSGRELMWRTSTNCEARVSVRDIRLSRCASVADETRGAGVLTAKATAGTTTRIAGQRRRGMSVSCLPDKLVVCSKTFSGTCRTIPSDRHFIGMKRVTGNTERTGHLQMKEIAQKKPRLATSGASTDRAPQSK